MRTNVKSRVSQNEGSYVPKTTTTTHANFRRLGFDAISVPFLHHLHHLYVSFPKYYRLLWTTTKRIVSRQIHRQGLLSWPIDFLPSEQLCPGTYPNRRQCPSNLYFQSNRQDCFAIDGKEHRSQHFVRLPTHRYFVLPSPFQF